MLIAGMFPGDIEFKAQRGTLSEGAPSKMQSMDLYLEVENGCVKAIWNWRSNAHLDPPVDRDRQSGNIPVEL